MEISDQLNTQATFSLQKEPQHPMAKRQSEPQTQSQHGDEEKTPSDFKLSEQ
jgi:hypothetical protein